MNSYPFTLSLKPNIQVIPSDDNYTLKPTEKNGLPANNILTFATFPGIDNALESLQQGNTTDALLETITEKDGVEASEAFSTTLQQIGDLGWLQYAVLPLAIAVPMVESAGVHLNPPHWTQANVSLSRFAYQRSHDGGMVLESPLSKFRVKLLDWRASAILAQLAQPQSLRQVTPPPQVGPETAYQFLNLLWATGFLDSEAEAPGLKLWEFHNLLFHSRCRQGRHNYPTGDIASSLEVWDEFPVVKLPMSGQIVPLPQLSIDAIRQRDKTLTTAIEKRSSIREYDENHPITIEQLGELLYRSARVKEIYTLDAEQTEMLKAEYGEDFDWGELSRRPYPCGGAMYELEIYPVVRRCAGVNPGLYHYDPLNHQLAQIDAADGDIQALLKDAYQSSGEQGMPQVLLIITARFGRLFRKYRSLAYALVLKHVGVLYQNLYLVATNMNLAPCSLGAGDSDRFAQASGLNYIEESSVGEFILGSLPNQSVEASKADKSQTVVSTSNTNSGLTIQTGKNITTSEIMSSDSNGKDNKISMSAQSMMVTPSLAQERPALEYSENLTKILSDLGTSLLISTYEGELIVMCPNGDIKNVPFSKDQLLGMAVDDQKLALSTTDRIWQLQNLTQAQSDSSSTAIVPDCHYHDACYYPISLHKTGYLFTHEMVWIDETLWFVNTNYSCLCTLQDNHEFIVQWHPPFISELVPEDRCHLNGLGVRDNRVRYVTAVSETDTLNGWRDIKDQAGILIDIQSNEILLRGLAMPHSPRWYKGSVWLLEAMKGTLIKFDTVTKEYKTVAKFPGFARELDISGDVAFVGTSHYRHDFMKVGETDQCGVWAVDLKTEKVIEKITFKAGINDISSVHLLPEIYSPKILGWPQESLQTKTPNSITIIAKPFSATAMNTTALVTPSEAKPVALHPHDLDERIPGLIDLRNQTLGDSRITIVILDGNADHSLSCFDGANISKVFPYWHDTPEAISVEDYATYQEIDNSDLKSEEKQEKLKAALPEPILKRIAGDSHACHITSTIVGQENTPSPGLAPNCRVINIPINTTGKDEEFIAVLNLSRAFELALELGANIIHCAACRPTQTGEGEELLMKALKKCQDNNVLVVAPAGNNKGECWCMPAALPGTLAVGAMKEDGVTPYKFSNWGGNNQIEGIMAPGGEILGAQPATEEPKRLKGTSMAAPVMTGLCGLLMSLQLQKGKPVDAEAVRAALLNTAIPCDPDVVEEPERCLRGFVNLPGAMNLLFDQPSVTISFTGGGVTRVEGTASAVESSAISANTATVSHPTDTVTVSQANSAYVTASSTEVSTTSTPAAVTPSTAYSGHVYALGTIGYDFGSEARRDTFKQLMPAVDLEGVMVPANPYNARQMVDYVDQNPDEGRSLIWTLNVDLTPVYVLEPKGPFAPEVYEMLLIMLDGQIELETSDEFIERVSIPARRTNRTVELMSGQVVPVITLHHVRGMYGWKVNTLVNAALRAVGAEGEEVSIETIRYSLTSFLNRVYYDLRNLGQTSRDRALNFAATNTFQAASTFAEAIADGRQLDSIEVEKSPYCRINSDCWDVKLKFFDPENGRRARKVFRFTIDVVENLPVTLGKIKSWSVPK